MLGFAVNIVQAFSISPDLTQIGILTFSNNARVRFYLNRYRNSSAIIGAVQELKITLGDTNIADALRMARTQLFSRQHGARSGLPKILILITDGTANIEERRTIPEANAAKAAGIQIFTVGIGSDIKVEQLRAIASMRSYYYFATNFDTLNGVLQGLLNMSCRVIDTVPTTPSPDPPIISTTSNPGTTGLFHCALAAAQCIVIGPVCGFVCGFVCLWVCYRDKSKLRASIFTKLGLETVDSATFRKLLKCIILPPPSASSDFYNSYCFISVLHLH